MTGEHTGAAEPQNFRPATLSAFEPAGERVGGRDICLGPSGHVRRSVGPPLSGPVEIDLKYLGGAPKRRKDGQKSKRGKGTAKPRILIAVQRDDRMRATVV